MGARRPPDHLAVGLVRKPHGVRGEVRVEFLTDRPERFQPGVTVHVGQGLRPLEVERLRLHQDHGILKLAGVEDRNAAESLRGELLHVPFSEAHPLEEGQFYEHQIIGLAVETTDGEHLGRVTEILYTGANDVYVVDGPRGEILLPAIRECIRAVDLEAGLIKAVLLAGLA